MDLVRWPTALSPLVLFRGLRNSARAAAGVATDSVPIWLYGAHWVELPLPPGAVAVLGIHPAPPPADDVFDALHNPEQKSFFNPAGLRRRKTQKKPKAEETKKEKKKGGGFFGKKKKGGDGDGDGDAARGGGARRRTGRRLGAGGGGACRPQPVEGGARRAAASVRPVVRRVDGRAEGRGPPGRRRRPRDAGGRVGRRRYGRRPHGRVR